MEGKEIQDSECLTKAHIHLGELAANTSFLSNRQSQDTGERLAG